MGQTLDISSESESTWGRHLTSYPSLSLHGADTRRRTCQSSLAAVCCYIILLLLMNIVIISAALVVDLHECMHVCMCMYECTYWVTHSCHSVAPHYIP